MVEARITVVGTVPSPLKGPMQFDIATEMTITSLLTFGVGASLSFAISRYPVELRAAMRVWIGGLFLQTFALIAVALAEPTPTAIVQIVGNTTYALAFAEMSRAMRIFFGQRRHNLPLLLVAWVALNSFVLGVVWPGVAVRVALNAAPLALLQLTVAWSVLFHRKGLRPADYLTGTLFVACAVLAVSRGLIELLVAADVAPALHRIVSTGVFVFGSILPMLGTIGFMLMCSDQLSDDLGRLAMIDPLTGAYNRRTLAERAQAAIGEATRLHLPLALLAIDVDHFKQINDEYGHDTGDEALLGLVRLMGESLDAGYVLSRIGGEEFAILMPGLDEAEACGVAERVRRHVADSSLSINGHTIRLRISIGVSALAGDVADLGAMLRAADRALYAAKRGGRDRVVAGATLARAPDRGAQLDPGH